MSTTNVICAHCSAPLDKSELNHAFNCPHCNGALISNIGTYYRAKYLGGIMLIPIGLCALFTIEALAPEAHWIPTYPLFVFGFGLSFGVYFHLLDRFLLRVSSTESAETQQRN